jgi:thiamine-monophosphate kinase
VGIGDDAAVLEPARNELDVVTTDILVEGVHFDARFSTSADVGHKALAVNLSDLAAMGASPRAALLSLALPGTFPVADFDALLDGFLAAGAAHGVALVGGNLSRSPGPLVVDVTAVGSVRRRRVLGRAGARPDDGLYLSGSIGGATAALEWLQATADGSNETHQPPSATLERYRRPAARVRLGAVVGRSRAASACVDLSDGLADAVHQIARASGTGAVLDAEAIPIDPDACAWFARSGRSPLDAALAGGEDYELLFAVPRRQRRNFLAASRLARPVPVTRIGTVTPGQAVVLRQAGRDTPLPDGFTHFGANG